MYYSNAVIGAEQFYSIFNSDTYFYHFGVVGKTEQVTYLAKSVSMNSVALGGHSEKRGGIRGELSDWLLLCNVANNHLIIHVCKSLLDKCRMATLPGTQPPVLISSCPTFV